MVISNRNSFRVLFDKIASVEMASPTNRHCVNCIGTLSFPMNGLMNGLSTSCHRLRDTHRIWPRGTFPTPPLFPGLRRLVHLEWAELVQVRTAISY